jgi:hypothetical protein
MLLVIQIVQFRKKIEECGENLFGWCAVVC